MDLKENKKLSQLKDLVGEYAWILGKKKFFLGELAESITQNNSLSKHDRIKGEFINEFNTYSAELFENEFYIHTPKDYPLETMHEFFHANVSNYHNDWENDKKILRNTSSFESKYLWILRDNGSCLVWWPSILNKKQEDFIWYVIDERNFLCKHKSYYLIEPDKVIAKTKEEIVELFKTKSKDSSEERIIFY
jgi:hypothetical protein